MPLNKPNGNMYPWAYTWNPLAGKCPHECGYCYVENKIAPMMKRTGNKKYYGELRLIEKEFQTRLIVPDGFIIFVESCGDLFADAVPKEMIQRILNRITEFPQTTFLLQSKNPRRFLEFDIPKNCIFGTTLETTNQYIKTKALSPHRRFSAMMILPIDWPCMISIEPVMDLDVDRMVTWVKMLKPKFVSIGADSGLNNLSEPSPKKLEQLITELKKFTEVKQKENLKRLMLNCELEKVKS